MGGRCSRISRGTPEARSHLLPHDLCHGQSSSRWLPADFHSIFPLYFFALLIKKAFLSFLAILWNSAFSWVYLSLASLPFAFLLFSAICKASSDNHFAFLQFFFMGIILVTTSCTMWQTSVHSSSGTQSTISTPLNLFQKSKGNPKKVYFCFNDYAKAFDCVDHSKLWKILIVIGIPDYFTWLLENLYAAEEATVRARHGATNWFKIGKEYVKLYIAILLI